VKRSSNFFASNLVSACPVNYGAHFTGATTSPKASQPRQPLNLAPYKR
jgi:hypothetical protein